MPLISLWKSNAEAVSQFTIEQVVSSAGDGILKDGSVCSSELREFLGQVKSEKLEEYLQQCLAAKLEKGGIVLQDIVNELGRRLDFRVENGRYQGTPSAVGFDGVWHSPEGTSIIVEVKTTDAYRVSLDTIAGYRQRLLAAGTLSGEPSILIVVGRQDTGELEAQVRGSRHAWDIRLISAEALTKLLLLKENSDDSETSRKIRSILTPMEFTRLDRLVDVLFTAATDMDPEIADIDTDISEAKHETRPSGVWEFTDSALLQQKRDQIIQAMSQRMGSSLVKKSRALFWTPDHERRVACTISKRYTRRKGAYPYWYAFHPQWNEFLAEGSQGALVLGCMDLHTAFVIPAAEMQRILPDLNITETSAGKRYWHVHIIEPRPGSYSLLVPKGEDVSLDKFVMALD